MAKFDFNEFLNILSDKQRAAVLSCRTEAEFEQVLDDFDIQIPDEMMEMVAGGRARFASVIIAGVLAATAAGATMAAAVNTMSVSVEAANSDTEARLQQCIADMEVKMQHLVQKADVKLVKDIKISFYGLQIELNKIAKIYVENENKLTIDPPDRSILSDIESAVRQADIGGEVRKNGDVVSIEFSPKWGDRLHQALRNLERDTDFSVMDICADSGDMSLYSEYRKIISNKIREFENDRRHEHLYSY